VSDDAVGEAPSSDDAVSATSEPSGPDLAHRALAEAKAAAVRARLSPSEEERMRAAAARGVRRREQVGQRRGAKGGDPVLFGAAINALLAARGWQGEAQVAAVMGRWDSLVGEALADKCAPVSLIDGELLMSANTLWSAAAIAPENLLAVVLEDGLYYITGGQRLGSPTGFAAVAAALPALAASSASTTAELREAVRVSARPGLVAVRIDEQLKPEPSRSWTRRLCACALPSASSGWAEEPRLDPAPA